MCSLAKNNFGTNNIKALEYAEKAFAKGNQDSELRNKYVDVLLKKDLDTKTQEKLLRIIKQEKTDLADAKAEQAFYNLRRETLELYPNNYIAQAPINQNILRWGKMPITYNFYVDKNTQVPNYFFDEITNAFKEWQKSTGEKLTFKQDEKNPNIIIYYLAQNPADEDDKKYVLAYTKPNIVGNKFNYSQINFYLHDIQGNYFSKNQVYNTALHEIAHALGIMGHSNKQKNILYLSSDPKTVLFDKRAKLTEADVETMRLLYDTKPDITNQSCEGKYIPYVVLGGNDDISTAKIREAEFYIKKAPMLPAGYMDLAAAYVAQKNYPKAIIALKKALKLANTDEITAMINYNLAIAYYYSENYENALKHINLASEFKDEASLTPLKMLIYKEMGNEIEMQKICAANPENIEYTITLTNFYIEQNQKKKARQVLKTFARNNPSQKHSPRFNSYGWIRFFL